jgi:TolB-like protein/Tfp pilus assembly protein PilF
VGVLVGGKFRVERALGQGGMGSVFVAVQEPLGRRVALKVIADAVPEPEHRERFLREARVVAQLKCPHVVTLHDFGEHEGEPYIVMELLDGETLRARMARGPVSLDQALLIARDLGCALRTAHEAGIVHRDVKPENIVLVPDRDHGARAKLLDFGIAKLRAHTEVAGATQLGMVIGTPGYIAPEQILLGRGDEPGVDLYALGVVLFEILTGAPPYSGPTPFAVMMAHAHDPLPRLPPHVPKDVAALVTRLLAKDPAERPADGAALVCALDELRARANAAVVISGALNATVPFELPLPDRPSVAVQPFQALGGRDDELFAEGISEDILTALSCFKQLFVVGLSSMWQRGGRDTDALRVSHSMGARYVLQGNVRRAGDRIRINAKLVDGLSGAQVWAQRYDRELRDLFEVQDDVTQAIVSCVAGRVEQAHVNFARKKAPQAFAAYDWLARGRALHHRRTREDNEEARAAVERAIELDPDYAQAHAWRGCVYGQACNIRGDLALYAADVIASMARALELDDNDAECHRLAAEVSAFVNAVPDADKAWYHHERAIALNPNDSRIVGQRGELLLYRGELEEAARALEQAARLDPLSPKPYQRHIVCVRYMQRDLAEAARLYKQLADSRPDILELGAAIAALRDEGELLRSTMERLREVTGGKPPFRQPRPFVTDELRHRWREGFERAGIPL